MAIQPAIDPRTGLPIPIATTGDTDPTGPTGPAATVTHRSSSITYISGTGVAGVDNTAQVVKQIALPANTLTQLGDRIRIRNYWRGDTGPAVTGTCTLNAVPVGHITDTGGTDLFVTESWLHYIDATHANIIEQEGTPGALGALSAMNAAGFQWDQPQTIALSQDAQVANHIIVYAVIVDVFLKGVE